MKIVNLADLGLGGAELFAKQLATCLARFDEFQVQQQNGLVLTPADLEANLEYALASMAREKYTAALAAWQAAGRVPADYPGSEEIGAPGFLPYLGAPATARNAAWARGTFPEWDNATQTWSKAWAGPTAGYDRFTPVLARFQAMQIASQACALFAPATTPAAPGSIGPGPFADAAAYRRWYTAYLAFSRGQFRPVPALDITTWADPSIVPVAATDAEPPANV